MRLIRLPAALSVSSLPLSGQEKMPQKYSAMPDLRCVGGFLQADGWWSTNQNKIAMERERRWVRISLFHDVLPVEGVQVGPDEPGCRLSSRAAGAGAPVVQCKVHLIQNAPVFLDILERCESREPLSLPRIG